MVMRLNLGAGPFYWPGFVNIDFEGDQDVTCDITDLSDFEDESVEEVHAIHCFEHLHRMKAETTLAEWRRVLQPAGRLVLELPCLNKMAKMIVEGEKNLRLTLLGLYGDPRESRPHMAHQWGWSEEEIGASLIDSGFTDIEYLPPAFHIEARDMRVEAHRRN